MIFCLIALLAQTPTAASQRAEDDTLPVGEAALPSCPPDDKNCLTVTVTDDPDLRDQLAWSCPAEGNKFCSYRAALQTIVETRYNPKTSRFAPMKIILPSGVLKVTLGALPVLKNNFGSKFGAKTVAIFGQPGKNATILDGGTNFTLLYTQSVDVNMSDITFINGYATEGGAVRNDAKMVVTRCNFSDNVARFVGGALQSTGDLVLDTVVFRNNKANTAGALASTGATNKASSLLATSVEFTGNEAVQTAGAFQNANGVATFDGATFEDHKATGKESVGGTVSNEAGGTLLLTDVSMRHSLASNSGGLYFGDKTSELRATRVTFSHGTAMTSSGGAVDNKGFATFHSCHFRENMAHKPLEQHGGSPQGATLANDYTNATAVLVNCTIDAARGSREGDPDHMVSEFFLSRSGAVLNLTFVNVTNCHKGLIQLEAPGTPNHPDKKVIIRGSSICEDDSSFADPIVLDATSQEDKSEWIAGCEEPETWQCGTRAICTSQSITGGKGSASGIGIHCACPVASDSQPFEMWGYPYGGEEPTINGSYGFSGCFEQWNTDLGSVSATGCILTPTFNPSAASPPSGYACCALSLGVTAGVHTKLTASPSLVDHARIATASAPSTATTVSSTVDAIALLSVVQLHTLGFNQSFTARHDVNVTWLDGNGHCDVGELVTCRNASGAIKTCRSQTKHPVDELDEYTTCKASSVSPVCGYTSADDVCDCPVCKANKPYACDCTDVPDGTQTCAADGLSLSPCDCSAKYPYPSPPPSPAPPGSPPSPGGGGKAPFTIIGGAAGAAAILLGIGGCLCVRRWRRLRERKALTAAFLNEAGHPADAIVPVPVPAVEPLTTTPSMSVYVAAKNPQCGRQGGSTS